MWSDGSNLDPQVAPRSSRTCPAPFAPSCSSPSWRSGVDSSRSRPTRPASAPPSPRPLPTGPSWSLPSPPTATATAGIRWLRLRVLRVPGHAALPVPVLRAASSDRLPRRAGSARPARRLGLARRLGPARRLGLARRMGPLATDRNHPASLRHRIRLRSRLDWGVCRSWRPRTHGPGAHPFPEGHLRHYDAANEDDPGRR